mgnify:CR=1
MFRYFGAIPCMTYGFTRQPVRVMDQAQVSKLNKFQSIHCCNAEDGVLKFK